ncbi:uncharacterized protein LOC113782028 [Coffea eugenioides]|uniref:uncharacterized protein LOC113782028 n=1 Tax=Coffea eugenioides TaxID=49369 RepID=UPI000F610E61|nr:uncharacterized protein LOC113782028 [Coffea eugenioides]
MSLSASALFPYCCPKITDEQFNVFHSMERQLYSHLIFDLGRDPEQSMQVIGFWMWLELVICTKKDLVIQLLKLPIKELKEVANESVVCLRCMGSEILPFADGNFELVLLPKLVLQNIRLELLHEYRLTVINEVRRRVRDVCLRAFKNILEKVVDDKFCGGSGSISTTASPGELMEL